MRKGKDPYLLLALSGGGSRAAAFALGVFEELDRWKDTENSGCSLLNHVGVISSVSGGGIAAAAYGYCDCLDTLRNFVQEKHFWKLIKSLFSLKPSPLTQRSDIFAKYLDEYMLNGMVLRDIDEDNDKPFLIFNATELGTARRFPFTEQRLSWIGHELSDIKVSSAVAASAAFPLLTNPITIPNKISFEKTPDWVESSLKDPKGGLDRYRRAQDWEYFCDSDSTKYVHLSDGGLSDNTGLRSIFEELNSIPSEKSFLHWVLGDMKFTRCSDTPKVIAVISVNAKNTGISNVGKSKRPPFGGRIVKAAASSSMDLRTDDSMELLENYFAIASTYSDSSEISDGARADSGWPLKGEEGEDRRAYCITVSIEDIDKRATMDEIQKIGTNYWIGKEAAEIVAQSASEALASNQTFQQFCAKVGFEEQ